MKAFLNTYFTLEPERFIYIVVENYIGPEGLSSQATQENHGQ